MTDPTALPVALPDAWLVALMSWDHHRHTTGHAVITWHDGIPTTDAQPAALLAVARALEASSPLDVTAAELTAAAERCALTPRERAAVPEALHSFTTWAAAVGLIARADVIPAPRRLALIARPSA